MPENHRGFRRADDGQRHHERARRIAAGGHRAAILGFHGLRTPRGFLVDPSSALLPRDVRASGEICSLLPNLDALTAPQSDEMV